MKIKIIIIALIVIGIAITLYFLLRKKKPENSTVVLNTVVPKPAPTRSGGSAVGTATVPPATTGVVVSTSNVGKVAYAKFDGLTVLNSDSTTVYKVAKKDEWIGTVISEQILGGGKFYKVSGNRFVPQVGVIFK